MRLPLRFLIPAAVMAFSCPAVRAQSLLSPQPVPLDSLAGFRSPAANWQVAGGIGGDPRHDKNLAGVAGVGVLVNNPRDDAKGHLISTWEHGDLELDLDFLLPPGSNSGVYLQSRYEVQLFDSWGKRDVTSLDCGAIYERWDDARGKGKEGFEGHAPKANASRAPGLWQHLHVEFEAPRFDASGRKTRNARFVKVVLNDFLVQENVEVTGPTRSAAENDERALGPLMIQGDHGPVAIQHLGIKRGGLERVAVEDLAYKLYPGDFRQFGDYDGRTPKSAGVPAKFAQSAIEKTGRFALVFTGTLVAPEAGLYAFSLDAAGPAKLVVDQQPVVVPLDRGTAPGTIALTAGRHPFRLDYIHASNGRPALEVMAEGPGIARHALTVREREERRPVAAAPMLLEVHDRVIAQRSFVPYEPRKRLYAINVGTPAGVNFAYDFETGALLRVWRGEFLDTNEMWVGRGEPQLGKPVGPALTLNAKPNVALIELPLNSDWPTQPEEMWSSKGYALEADGLPVFNSLLYKLKVSDRFAPTADGHGLTRRVEFSGDITSWSTWLLLADSDKITPQPGGGGWIVGDREWYLDWPADSRIRPVIRRSGEREQLAVPVTRSVLETPITYTLVW